MSVVSLFGRQKLELVAFDTNANNLEQEIDSFIEKVQQLPTGAHAEYMKQIASLIPTEKLAAMAQGNEQTIVDQALSKLDEARYYLKITEHATTRSLYSVVNQLIDFLTNGLDNVIGSFGIHSFFKPARNDFENKFKSQIAGNIISAATLFTATLLPLMGKSLAGPIIGGLFALIAVTSLFYPAVKPLPSDIIEADPWTKKAEAKNLERGLTCISDIAKLAENLKSHKRVIITGASRAGKTQAVKDLTYALLEQNEEVTKSLPDVRKVFSWNTASLVGGKGGHEGTSTVLKITDQIGRHGKKIVAVFDEFGKTCINPKNAGFVGLLLTEIEKFEHIVLLATDDEFKTLTAMHPTLVKRLTRQSLEYSTLDTKTILYHTLLQEAPEVLVEDDALGYLVEEFQNQYRAKAGNLPVLPQPHTAKEMLRRCIQKVSASQSVETTVKRDQQRAKVEGLCLSVLHGSERDRQALLEAKNDLNILENTHRAQKAKFLRLIELRQQLSQAKSQKYQTIIKMAHLATNHIPVTPALVNSLILLDKMITNYTATIKLNAKEQKVSLIINKEIADQVIQEELSKYF